MVSGSGSYRFPDKQAAHVCGTSHRTNVGAVVERAAVRALASNARDALELVQWLDMLGLTADAGKAAA